MKDTTILYFLASSNMLSPCIMCVQYRGGAQYRGVFSTVGDIMSTVEVFSTVGDIMSTVGGYLEYRGDVQYHGGYHDAHGGYHEYCGGSLLLFEYPMVQNTPMVLMISPTCIMISPRYSNFKGWYPPWY